MSLSGPISPAAPPLAPKSRLAFKLLCLLPVVALILIGLTFWKMTRPPQGLAVDLANATAVRFAPPFELRDRNQSLVRLSTFLGGREKVLVVFFEASKQFSDSPVLNELSRSFHVVHSRGPKILAIGTQQSGIYRRWIHPDGSMAPEEDQRSEASQAIADHIEQNEILLLSDLLEPHVYRQWGAVNRQTGELAEAVFVVDRAGWIRKSYVGQTGTADQWARDLGTIR